MNDFKSFKEKFQKNFEKMSKDTVLFEVEIDKDLIWELYLKSFPEGTNPMFRERTEYDCSCCRSFVKNFGNVITIKDNKVVSVWDFETESTTFQPVVDNLKTYIYSLSIADVYVSKEKKIGTNINREIDKVTGKITEWQHFYIELPDRLVNKSDSSLGEIKGNFKAIKGVFKRSLDEITQDSVETVLELIKSNTLYKGNEWDSALTEFLKYKKEYAKLESVQETECYAWLKSVMVGGVIGKIRNHSIGNLLVNISEGMELDTAVRKYEALVAPESFKRPKPIYSKRDVEEGTKILEKEGLLDSLERRHATLQDITVNNILFSNKGVVKNTPGGILEEMKNDVALNPKKFSKVEEITIENFLKNVLPTANSIDLLLENRHSKNMVSLITKGKDGCKPILKWSNDLSWSYTGNITDSSIKDNVKNAGGDVTGVLRFSIQWNDGEYNGNDFDAHCIEPSGHVIYFGDKRNISTSGQLDVDIINPDRGKPAVENITWSEKRKMQKGTYKFLVNNFSHRGGKDGFKAEIEFCGQIFNFDYGKELRYKENVEVAEVTFDGENFTIKEKLPSTTSSKDIWNLKTNNFVPVSVIMYSPNYWDLQTGIGNKHFFFMLKGCVNSETPNGFYNEFLKEDFMKYKRFFEALGSKMRVKETENQLSGVGFSSTMRNEVIVKVKGSTERTLKIKF